MCNTEIEIVVDDPTAPETDSPAVTSIRTVDSCLAAADRAGGDAGLRQLAHRHLLGFDRPAGRLFSFYLSVILAGASLYGLVAAFCRARRRPKLRHRAQPRRVLQVFVPTLLFCLATQFLGLYVASFVLIAGFMRLVGKIALWKSLLTAFVFTAIMFVTFDIAFDVIMPKGPLEAAFGYAANDSRAGTGLFVAAQ